MKKTLLTTTFLCLASASALAQTTTATGVGISGAEANSGALAVSTNRGNGNSSSSLNVTNPSETRSTVNSNLSGTTTSNINQTVSGATTTHVVSSGSTTVRTAPSMVAPGLAAAGLETCLGSASGTVSAIGFGIGGGSTYADEGCQARLDSRTLYAYGLKAAAVARLCQRVDIWRSMPDMCAQYWPSGVPYPAGIEGYVPARTAVMSASVSLGSIRVVDGRDGVEKDCLNYSETKHKCYQWAGEKHRQVAAVTPTKPVWTRAANPKAAKPPKLPTVITAPSTAPEPPPVM